MLFTILENTKDFVDLIMAHLKLLYLSTFILISWGTSAQEYYNFSEKIPDKGHLAISPIGGIIIKSGGGIGFVASGRLQYFISENISGGAQFVQLFDTGNEDYGWIGDNAAPKSSVHLIVGGHFFPNHNRFGFHGTAGLGYILSEGKNLTSYFDIGVDYKLTKYTTFQLQTMEIGLAALGIGLAVQIKL